jgi:hypothetical protein
MKPQPLVEAMLARHVVAYPRSGFRVPDAWLRIVDDALGKMTTAGWDRELRQVKEKFGGLRLYLGPTSEALDAIIEEARAEAAKTCACCGDPGSLRNLGGWLATLCNPCELRERAERQA